MIAYLYKYICVHVCMHVCMYIYRYIQYSVLCVQIIRWQRCEDSLTTVSLLQKNADTSPVFERAFLLFSPLFGGHFPKREMVLFFFGELFLQHSLSKNKRLVLKKNKVI